MSNFIGADIAWHLKRFRDETGTQVEFNGQTYNVRAEEVSGADVGMNALQVSRAAVGPDIANADPHKFCFSPADFVPNTDVWPPQKDDTLVWHGRNYIVSHTTADDLEGETIALLVYAYWLEGVTGTVTA